MQSERHPPSKLFFIGNGTFYYKNGNIYEGQFAFGVKVSISINFWGKINKTSEDKFIRF